MAATKAKPTKLQQDQTRAAIKTTQLVKRLQAFALGEREVTPNSDGETKLVEIDPGRLKAIEILLRKSLPDLSSVTLSGDPDEPIRVEHGGAASEKLTAFLDAISSRASGASE